MSLAEKWEEYAKQIANWPEGKPVLLKDFIKRAFYAGAEAALRNERQNTTDDERELAQLEIDHFRSHK